VVSVGRQPPVGTTVTCKLQVVYETFCIQHGTEFVNSIALTYKGCIWNMWTMVSDRKSHVQTQIRLSVTVQVTGLIWPNTFTLA